MDGRRQLLDLAERLDVAYSVDPHGSDREALTDALCMLRSAMRRAILSGEAVEHAAEE